MAEPIKLVDRFGGLGDALDEAKRRMGLSPGTRVQLFELPGKSSSLFGTIAKLLGASADAPRTVLDLPLVQTILRGVPGSVLVAPDGAQARLPYDIVFD
jgi:hypothetical protein